MKTTKSLLAKAALTFVAIASLAATSQAQNNDEQSGNRQREIISAGIGMGLDYGGIGLGMTFYPQKNIGLFANGGIFLAGPSYTVGLKARYVTKKMIDPYITFQYGYSGCVSVFDDNGSLVYDKGKLFMKPNVGLGIDIHFTKRLGLSGGITTNTAVSDIREYADELEAKGEADFGNSIIVPFGISCGLRWTLR